MPSLVGQTIGRYHILEPLGEGGMATVYKAFDTQLERQVAIKFIRGDFLRGGDADVVSKRFKREARVLAKLTHPNILTLLDYGEYDGQLYLVTAYISGGNLKDRLGRPISWQETVRLLSPIARALEYAHGQGILHRDIKPSNILLSSGGLPVLADFGIAKISQTVSTADLTQSTQSDQDLTRTDTGIGTPEYMAPEAGRGQADQRSDVYSLGVVMYEMITGRKPFVADTSLAILMLQATEPLLPPHKFVAGLPGKVEQVIFKALAKKPENRYQMIGDFARALEVLASGAKLPLSLIAPEETRLEKVQRKMPATKPAYRPLAKWPLWLAGAAAIILLILGLVWVDYQMQKGYIQYSGDTVEIAYLIVAVVAFLYIVLWGEKSAREVWEGYRKKRQAQQSDDVPKGAPPARVFVSYSRRDLVFVERLAWDLKAAGLDVWYDLSGLEVGSRWGKEIQTAIRESQYFVVVLSPDSIASDWVEREFLYADKLKIKVIPLLYRSCDPPMWALDRQYIDIQGPKYNEHFAQLLKTLDVGVGCAETPSDVEKFAASSPRVKKEAPEFTQPVGRRRLTAREWLFGVAVFAVLFGAALIILRPHCSIWPKLCPTSTPPTPPPAEKQIEMPIDTPVPTDTPASIATLDPSVQTALYEIRSAKPLYQTDFGNVREDSYDPRLQNYGQFTISGIFWNVIDKKSLGRVSFENGKLTVSSPGPEFDGIGPLMRLSNRFAVMVDVKSNENQGSCVVKAQNIDSPEILNLYIYQPDGLMELAINQMSIIKSSNPFDFSKYNTVTVIVLGDRIGIFVNDQNALAIMVLGLGDVDLWLGSYDSGKCEFDNFKLWELKDSIP